MAQSKGTTTVTGGEIAFMSMVLVLFFAFIIVIGTLSQTQEKREE